MRSLTTLESSLQSRHERFSSMCVRLRAALLSKQRGLSQLFAPQKESVGSDRSDRGMVLTDYSRIFDNQRESIKTMMTPLSSQTCVPCKGSDPPLSPEEIEEMRALVANWRIVDKDGIPKLTRFYQFSNFKRALAFTQKVGEAAEQAGHHPMLITEWGKVSVFWWTHVISGLHQNDFIMAAKTDLAYEAEA